MSTSQNLQIHPTSIQLPRLFPSPAYQPLSDPPTADTLSQTNILDTIPPDTNQTYIVRNSESNDARRRDAQAEFNKSFNRFFKKYCSNQSFTLMFFAILIIGSALSSSLATVLLIGFAVVYLTRLGQAWYRAETMTDVNRVHYKMLEFFVSMIMLIWNPFKSSENFISVFFACLFLSYLFKVVVGYYYNCSELIKFTNQVNKRILGIRICIFSQGMLLVTLSVIRPDIPIPIIFIPLYAMILMIALFTANLIRSIYFTYHSQFWRTDVNEKKTGVKWIFGNLFGLISILLLEIYILLVDEGDSEILVLVATVTWCAISLLFSEYCFDGVFKVCETLAILVENNGDISTRNESEEKIKYVIRISNTYFRPVNEQEISNSNNNQTNSIETASENDLEAGVENNAEEKAKCIVCCRKSANAVFMRCGHGGVCFSCGKKINNSQKECHMCRQKIKAILKMNIKKDNKDNVYEIVREVRNQERELDWYSHV